MVMLMAFDELLIFQVSARGFLQVSYFCKIYLLNFDSFFDKHDIKTKQHAKHQSIFRYSFIFAFAGSNHQESMLKLRTKTSTSTSLPSLMILVLHLFNLSFSLFQAPLTLI